ncbi:MAG: hypothetical protein GYB31_05915 [Bacteroidetes bacterium]|nr:hypothetical protein [Bacteroidota bacterium]
MMKKLLLPCLFFFALSANAQFDGPRLFWDIPSIYLTAPDVGNISQQAGIGIETAFNVAVHYGTVRAGGGAFFTVNPGADDIPESFFTTPYFLLEAGGGLYRTNPNKCASSNRGAFTAMGILGMRYHINTRDLTTFAEAEKYGAHFGMGVELGYFYIQDMFRNTEVVLRGTYYPGISTFSAELGMKIFFNVREFGRY